ncbi:PepSY domain-containing protein [Emticicia sp. BO119]|uniref:PepSY-associated TM helix domain-containing protein n=1 Tax=Emticicia sp. BO119 TaxID=2757768 RepID=UPI0015F0C662|nr:PepSY-associated TM helix domain-containing protein [Emticicia sp. BO119]MBA4853497.1 PepSY domain-containing protein [Emticicia sp. BO119]
MTFKKAIGKIHLWLGLVSGLVVFIVSITGCIYAFQVEIQDLIQSYRYVEIEKKTILPPSTIKSIVEKAVPDKVIHSITYERPGRAAIATIYHYEPTYYYLVYVNPYSGQVLKAVNMDEDFFRFILDGHFYLWLPEKIGQPVVASATLIFIFLMISGLVLWWPKNKSAANQRFTIKWNAKWRRVNYDLHNVLGFYMTWVVIIIAVTGLVWGFQWFSKTYYYTISGGKTIQEYYEPESGEPVAAVTDKTPAIDKIWKKMRTETPDAATIEVHPPETSKSTIVTATTTDADVYWKHDYRYFDQYTLKEVSVTHPYGRLKDISMADKIMRMNYDIHVGAAFGFAGKVLAFFASLIAASLPVTGFCIWWGRRKKATKGVARPATSKSQIFKPRYY